LGYLATGVPFLADWNALAEACRRTHAAWLAEARRRSDEFRESIRETGRRLAQAGTHAIDILDALEPHLRGDAALCIDAGSVGQWAHQLLAGRYPPYWLTCGRSGVVGWGIGGAMAARLVYPDRPVVLLSGDGAFTFNVADLECAARQSLPFVAIVADDQAWGITQTGHRRQFGEAIASSLGPVDFAQLARSLGARGVSVRGREEIAPALAEALATPAVTVLHIPIVGGNPS
ncbi:MAG: thiamine pyrophosphate-dependent enzyme, partial [Bryobacteraceae bacterium]